MIALIIGIILVVISLMGLVVIGFIQFGKWKYDASEFGRGSLWIN